MLVTNCHHNYTVSWLTQSGTQLFADLHDLLQRVTAGAQLGHGEGSGDADGGHEDVGLWAPAEGQMFVECQGEAAVGLGQLPHSGVGRLRDGLHSGLFRGFGVWAAVDAARLQGKVSWFGTTDVRQVGGDKWQHRQKHQPVRSPHSGREPIRGELSLKQMDEQSQFYHQHHN